MSKSKKNIIEECVAKYIEKKDTFEMFSKSVADFFLINAKLNSSINPIIHSVKYRVKDPNHLRDKLYRKWNHKDKITKNNLFSRVTDLAGVRVLHLHYEQFKAIHDEILKRIKIDKEWILVEKPVAYTWDIERKTQYEALGLNVQVKESHYTSVHYIVKPNNESIACCEIQVRTLFEEIWGEIDHSINYPHETSNITTKEQIRVLAKLVNAGSRLADSIFLSNKLKKI